LKIWRHALWIPQVVGVQMDDDYLVKHSKHHTNKNANANLRYVQVNYGPPTALRSVSREAREEAKKIQVPIIEYTSHQSAPQYVARLLPAFGSDCCIIIIKH